ncbi:MAG TPA: KOW domain-containing RNA-binding protein [Pseudobacteroides sp.]|uniref:KOW domain-containing RNA-binding protein n=1 Tax=Pseudobacteroides sp. TaxID=1968840 RepID=UPI002F923AED
MVYTIGQVVYSKAGRDAGRKFIIISIPDESYVYISDGDLRKIEKPKRKKAKHLLITEEVVKPLSEKLLNKMQVTNSEVRRALEDPRQ